MLPTLVLGTVFTFYPMVASWHISLLDWSGLDTDRIFVGLANYREAVTDPAFWDAFGRTFLFTAAAVPVMLVLALLAAIVLNDQALRMRAVFRTMFFLPVVTTTAIVGVVMSMIMNPFDGPLNQALLDVGAVNQPIDFLGDPNLSLWSVAGVFVWKWMGMAMIYWLVALQTVPHDLYEAARVDGAGWWALQRHITLPMITPFAVIIVLVTFVGALQTFPLVQSMTQGGPAYSSELVELYIYRLAFASQGTPRLGYASAVAVFFGITVLALTLVQAWGVRRAGAFRRDVRDAR
ncbi:MAG: ABC transporter permease subunit [Streptosporangiales bacterium]|nr:ABC transporter permease subunit [Streptosporangiales bacterium]